MPATAMAETRACRDLAVGWMNHGHTLMLRNDPVSLASALDAYNEAIAGLRRLPVAENPSWANSLGAALMNRGHLLHRLHGVAQATLALQAFDEAAALLRPQVFAIEKPESKIQNPRNPWPRRNFTGTLINRANLLLDLACFAEGAAAAREALALAGPHAHIELVDADLALKARRGLCDALGRLLVAPGTDQAALATEASDIVDEALALIRHWTMHGETGFAALALRFFHYGTQLYRLHQPHFLAEFIRENLAIAGPELRAVARDSIEATLADQTRSRGYLTIGDPVSERLVRTCRELEELRSHLAA
jgi:hypothetical protein